MASSPNGLTGHPSSSTVLAAVDNAYGSPTSLTQLGATAPAISNSGGSQAHDNMMPFLTLSFCIALQGIFPSRNRHVSSHSLVRL